MARDRELHWGRSTVDTACPLDCPDACSLAVSIEKGKITKIDGTRRNPVTRGFICAKVRRFGERVTHDERLLFPAVRRGAKGRGEFRRVTWDEALNLLADKMQAIRARWGGEALLPFYYGGSNGYLTQHTTDLDLFSRIGASRLARTVCAAPTGAAAEAMYGKMGGVAYEDYVHARLIVIWGANPSVSGIHLVPYVREAQRRGAKLVVVDPRRTPLARHADLHLAVRPGSDLAVALALIRALFDEGHADRNFLEEHATGTEHLRAAAAPWTFERASDVSGVDVDELRAFKDLYAASSPAVIRCGWGLERNRNGGHSVMAVLALPAVAGKFGVRGGGYTMSNSGAWGIDATEWRQAAIPDTRIVNMNHLGRALTEYDDPPIKLLFVYNCNPASTMPDQNRVLEGLARDDLYTVVFDQVQTDSVRWADLVLPATTFLEHYDVARGYGAYALQLVVPVVEAAGESRPNAEVFSDLAGRLGLAETQPEDDCDVLLRVTKSIAPPMLEPLLATGIAEPASGATPVQFVDVVPKTADGKVHLFPENLETRAEGGLYAFQSDPATPTYPLALISPASDKTISSTLGELRGDIARLMIHPADAELRGLSTGDAARVHNDRGDVHCIVAVGDDVARGTVALPKGLWARHTLNGSTANALAPDALADLGGGACFNDARVEVTRIVSAQIGGSSLALWVGPGPDKPH
jgi:anaerobic selenocysteine-containing dehydrogenase